MKAQVQIPMPILRLPNACLSELPSLAYTEAELQGNRLTGLHGFPDTLLKLNVSQNRIDQDGLLFPFPSLQVLNAAENQICLYEEDDFVSHFPSVTKLDLSRNRLRSTTFLRGSSVEEANLQENPIRILAGLSAPLRNLSADRCEITLVQSKLPETLEQLDLGYNSLRFAGLPLRWSPVLRELHLDGNKIEIFPRNLPDSLEVLTLNENRLTAVPSKLPSSLRVLLMKSNRLRFFPDYKGRRHFNLLLLDDNCLTVEPNQDLAQTLSAESNWTGQIHIDSAKILQRCWKRCVLTLRLRHLLRTKKLRPELLMVSMHPDRMFQIDSLDPLWFRKDQGHIHTDRR